MSSKMIDADTMEKNAADRHGASAGQIEASSIEATGVLNELIKLMGYGDWQVVSRCEQNEKDGDRLVLEIQGEGAEAIIGEKGQTLDALQFIVSKVINRNRQEWVPILVDACGYRRRREEALVQLALRLSEQVTKTGKTVAVNPMSAHDRRVMHLALEHTPGVTTQSEGEGENRRILIMPSRD